jgi:hypothetical protein
MNRCSFRRDQSCRSLETGPLICGNRTSPVDPAPKWPLLAPPQHSFPHALSSHTFVAVEGDGRGLTKMRVAFGRHCTGKQ